MTVHFFKYHGTGNDFIIIDNRNKFFDKNNSTLISELCNRRFGIGADGLMLIENHSTYDFEMIYFNSDGKKGTMCGNGGRCIISFAKKLGLIKNSTKFVAYDKIYIGSIENNIIKLKFQDVQSIEEHSDNCKNGYIIDTGSPHFVKFVDNIENINVFEEGRKIRYSDKFKIDGINIDFVKIENDNTIFVKTYERGVEDETYSCGTGVVASAIATSFKTKSEINNYKITTKGGNLKVSFEKSKIFENIWLEGPATFVFDGEIEIN
jgi:diaminopimelate epimerase